MIKFTSTRILNLQIPKPKRSVTAPTKPTYWSPVFNKFIELPLEIRRLIWKHCTFSDGQLLSFKNSKEVLAVYNLASFGRTLPVIAHVNLESRAELFRYFCLHMVREDVLLSPRLGPHLHALDSVRHVSVDYASFRTYDKAQLYADLLLRLPGIRTLTVILGGQDLSIYEGEPDLENGGWKLLKTAEEVWVLACKRWPGRMNRGQRRIPPSVVFKTVKADKFKVTALIG